MGRNILFLNGCAIIAVVLFHSSGMGFVAMFAWAQRYLPVGVVAGDQVGTLSYYGLRIIEQIVVFAIPAFLFISGYSTAIVAGRSQKNIKLQFVLSRIKNLLIPYLIWSAIVILLRILEGKTYSPSAILTTLLTGSANEVLYFVPLLIQFYLLTPFIVAFARKNWKALLLISGIMQIIIVLFSYIPAIESSNPQFFASIPQIPKWLFLSRVFWFPAGIIAGFHSTSFKKFIERNWRTHLAIALIFIPLGILEWEVLFRLSGQEWLSNRETLIDTIYTIFLIFSILALKIPSGKGYRTISDIGTKSYGIYLTHAIFIEYTARAIYHFAPRLLGYQIFLQPIFIIVGLGLPLLIMKLVDLTPVRKYYTYIYG